AGDGGQPHRAVWQLVAVHRQAVTLIRDRLHPIKSADAQRIQQLIADLDSDQFAVRQQATEELEMLGKVAETALPQTLEQKPVLEVRTRILGLLEKLRDSTGQLRALRAVEVLERIGTTEARQVLQSLAGGAPGVTLTEEARAALERLARTTPLS